jgi:uncharacterized protein (TIGR03000 family)
MLRRTFALGGTLLGAAALVFLTPSPGAAAFRPGFHPGFRAGVFHPGAFHVGGYPYHPHYGGHPYGLNRALPYAWGYHGRDPYSYAHPYYGYGPSPAGPLPPTGYDPENSGYSPSPGLSPPDSAAPGGATLTTGDLSPAPSYSGPSETTAHITVGLPADARLWFGNTLATATGSVRDFESPPLEPGTRYTYTVTATWKENGREVTQTQRVPFAAGAYVEVRFPAPGTTPGTASAPGGG